MRGRTGLLVGAATVALAFGAGAAAAATPADTFVMAKQIDDIITLDPQESFEFSGNEINANTYERVMNFDATDLVNLKPAAAESFTVSDDGKTITFKIRDAKFASGAPVTAEDVAFSLQRGVKMNKSPGFILTQLGWDKDNVDKLVKAVDPKTLQVTITEDFGPGFVLSTLSANIASVVEKKVVLQHEKDGDLGNGWLKTAYAGSGAFVMRSWKPNESVVLEANPTFWRGAPQVKRVVVRHVPEPATQRLLLEKGDVDMARNLSADQVAGLAGNKDVIVESSPKAEVYYMGLNQKDERLRNPKVRQALRWLVDYQGMTDSFLKGRFKVHQGFWPSGFAGSLTETPFKLDVAKAKALLAEAGYPNGFEVALDASNSYPSINVAQSVQATMGQAGVKVNIIPGEQKQVITKYRARNHQMVFLYWSPDYVDPHSNADTFTRNPDNSDNAKSKPLAWRNAWEIPELTKKTDAAARERDPAKRLQMYLELQKAVQEDSPFIIAFQAQDQPARRANVKGFVAGPFADQTFYRLVQK